MVEDLVDLMLVKFHCDKWREQKEEGFHVPIRIHQLYPLHTAEGLLLRSN